MTCLSPLPGLAPGLGVGWGLGGAVAVAASSAAWADVANVRRAALETGPGVIVTQDFSASSVAGCFLDSGEQCIIYAGKFRSLDGFDLAIRPTDCDGRICHVVLLVLVGLLCRAVEHN